MSERNPFEFRGSYFDRPDALDKAAQMLRADQAMLTIDVDGRKLIFLSLAELGLMGLYQDQSEVLRFIVQPPAGDDDEALPARQVFRICVEYLGTVE